MQNILLPGYVLTDPDTIQQFLLQFIFSGLFIYSFMCPFFLFLRHFFRPIKTMML